MKTLIVLYVIGWVLVAAMLLAIRSRLAAEGDPRGTRRPAWVVAVRCAAWPFVLLVGFGTAIGQRVPLDDGARGKNE